jgi:diguanylate cyclase (GGDEF)-like protein/PAS domain S-box-containing protein
VRDTLDRLRLRLRLPSFGRTTNVLVAAAAVLGVDLAFTWLQGEPLEAFGGRLVVLLVVVPAITWYLTDRVARRSEQRERELHDRHETLLHNISDFILVVDGRGAVQYQSPSVERTLGYADGELIGTKIDNLLTAPDSPSVLEQLRALKPIGGAHLACQLRQRDGRLLAVDTVAASVADEAGADGLVLTMHDVSAWKQLEEQLTRQALHDPLTDLPNRALYIDRLDHALARRRRHAKGIAVLFLDLDDFKNVNDSLGHGAGDNLITDVAARLLESIRPGDSAARLGGDEFAVLLEDVDEGQAAGVATRILTQFERPFDLGDRSLLMGASIGIALSSDELATASDMLRAADTAMYAAKDAGKGQYRTFLSAMHRASNERLRLGADLRGVVERGEMVVHYQPIVDLPGGEVSAMEALVRWAHPDRGLLAPADFVPLAERSGLIIPIGEFVLREACRQAYVWQQARPDRPVGVSVNVSGVQLQDAGFVASVSLALEETRLAPQLLTLEITESVMTLGDDDIVRRLQQLAGMGVRLALDDFGTGYSSLASIGRFPIDEIKIDKRFINDLTEGPDEVRLVKAIIRLAHSLKVRTVAEGVELEEQSRRLISAGCDRAQGYLFSRPLDARQASTFLLGHTGVTVWIGHWGHELKVINDVLADFEERYPRIKVEVVGGMHDDRIIAALREGTGPSVVSSFESGNFGTYASAAGLVDLQPYLERDDIDPGIFPEATKTYTRFGGKRWALPMLADAYGLYYDQDLFAAEGLSGPPRRISELSAFAKRLTRRRPDGSLAVVGFNPMFGFYENTVAIFGHHFGARWFDDEGASAVGSDPAWAKMFRWQKELVDWYGHDRLVRFRDEVGEEFSRGNAFETGRMAMSLDGEWRVAFLAANGSTVRAAAAPMPTDDARPDLYGSGFISGTIMGIRAGTEHQDEAWEVVKYLTTDDDALAKLANGLRNIPSTRSALRSPGLMREANFAVFMDVFAHPRSTTPPITAIGTTYQDVLEAFATRWQAGKIRDLARGLREVDRRINAKILAATGEELGRVPARTRRSRVAVTQHDLSAAITR